MAYELGGNIEAADYNQLITDVNKIFGTGISNFGYGGQSLAPNPLSVSDLPKILKGETIDNQSWLDLRTAFVVVSDHQGTTLTDGLPSVADIEDGDPAAFFPRLASSQNLFDITDNRFNINPLFTPVITSQLTSVRTLPWSSLIKHEFIITFSSTDRARAFFNLGGTIQIATSRVGGDLSVQNASWDSIISTNSPFIIDRDIYFSLTSAFEELRPQISPFDIQVGVYNPFRAYALSNLWTMQGRRDDEQGPNGGNGSIIRISSNFLDGSSNSPDKVNGTFTSQVSDHKFNDIFDIESPTYRTVRGVEDGDGP